MNSLRSAWTPSSPARLHLRRRRSDGLKIGSNQWHRRALYSLCPFGTKTRIGQCEKCSANSTFELHLREASRRAKIPLVYILPNRGTQTRLYEAMKGDGVDAVSLDLRAFGLTRTPTMVSVDRQGLIQAMFVGTVSPDSEIATIKSLLDGITRPVYQRASMAAIEDGDDWADTQLILPSSTQSGFKSKAPVFQMPQLEIVERARYELDANKRTALICSAKGVIPYSCQETLLSLYTQGFHDLIAVDLPARKRSDFCRTQNDPLFRESESR